VELRQIETFRVVAQELSFSRAAAISLGLRRTSEAPRYLCASLIFRSSLVLVEST
jgi:hypothetical protein